MRVAAARPFVPEQAPAASNVISRDRPLHEAAPREAALAAPRVVDAYAPVQRNESFHLASGRGLY